MEKINITNKNSHVSIEYNPIDRKSLSDILRDNNILLPTPCGGHGVCGKCRVTITSPELSDVIACKYYPTQSIEATLITPVYTSAIEEQIYQSPEQTTKVSIGIDIGSTSISIQIQAQQVLAEETFFNLTAQYGADIITRLQHYNSNQQHTITTLLQTELTKHIEQIMRKLKLPLSSIQSVCISCNNTMQHILLGLDGKGLEQFPFQPAATTFQPKHYHQSLVTLIPSISAFIGGDIVSGLYYLSTKDKTAPYLFLDLGTNAEIALVLKDRILCTSTAAGPAFEGTNISCGCAHIPGAIYSIEIKRPRNKYKTINNKIPVGVCGSGILSLYSELISKQLVDSFGMLSNEYFDTGFQITTTPSGSLTITQKDIRQIQLAIAAIKTGIDLLIQKSYLSINDINHVYLSGSFGSSLDLTTLSNINLFPKDWIQKKKLIEPLGNSSLKGAISYLKDPNNDLIEHIITNTLELSLPNEPNFNELFLSNMQIPLIEGDSLDK